ncbi:MAG: hypothetical protein CTY15_08975 [Methylocystis sp.]|nr:MAG: hypothetical protein CTY15_08975 [Methylocystis sp.]
MCLFQLAAPASIAWRQERTLARGAAFRFQTAPVDPYDAFRGRYVALSFRDNLPILPKGTTLAPGAKVYAPIEVGADGFARFGEVLLTPPEGKPYLTLRLSERFSTQGLPLPFDRFYLEETKAPAAEVIYRKHARDRDAWLVVRILDGDWAIEDLFVGGKPIREAIAGP